MPEPLQEEQKAATIEEYMDMPGAGLAERVNFWNRWKSWAIKKGISWATPFPPCIALFLRSRREAGPTAPHGAYTQFRWFEKFLGFQAHTLDPSVLRRSQLDPEHEAEPTKPLPPKLIMWLLHIVGGGTDHTVFETWLATFWLFLTAAALRFAHGQRACINKVGTFFMMGTVSRGKARVKGKRVPTSWTASRFMSGVDLAEGLQGLRKYYQQCTYEEEMWFILPDFFPERGQLREAEGVIARPMLMGRALAGLRELAGDKRANLTKEEIDDLGGHGPRHVMPTQAHLSRFSTPERVDVGGWAGRGLSSEAERKEIKAVSLPLHYAGQEPRLRTAAANKFELCLAFDIAVANMATKHGFAPRSGKWVLKFLASDTACTWEGLADHWPGRRETTKTVKDAIDELDNIDEVVPQSVPAIFDGPITSESQDALPIEDECSDSSTSSDSSDDGSEADAYPEGGLDKVQWAKARRGLFHMCCKHDEGLVEQSSCVCGRKLIAPVVGVGIDDAIGEGGRWSPRCFKALPEAFRSAWASADRVELSEHSQAL